MSKLNIGAVEIGFWIRDNDRMLISAAATEQISNKINAAHAAGAAEERARWIAAIEAEMGEWYEGSSTLAALERLLGKVKRPDYSWSITIDGKYEASLMEARPCGECLHFKRLIDGSICRKHLIGVLPDMHVTYMERNGSCFEPAAPNIDQKG